MKPLLLILVLVVANSTLATAPAQTPTDAAADVEAEAAEARAVAKTTADGYVVHLQDPDVTLERQAEPVLRWTNQRNRRFYGEIYVWTHQGRPEAVASINRIYVSGPTTEETEFESLSTGRPRLSIGESVVWKPAVPGVEWKPIPGAGRPAPSAAARLPQMRALAAEFATTGKYGPELKEIEELRLLRTPVFRYASQERGVTDGTLFAFSKGTDPDVLLLIEARGEKEAAEWQFAFARLNGYAEFIAVRQGVEVWHVDRHSHQTNTDPTQPYFLLRK